MGRHLKLSGPEGRRPRTVALAFAAILGALGRVGCGGSSGAVVVREAPVAVEALSGSPLREIEAWAHDARILSAEVDRGEISATEFGLRPPPARPVLRQADIDAWFTGFYASLSTPTMERFSDLDAKEVAHYTCYVFDWYVEHGAPLPGSAEFAQFMAQNLEAEWLSLPAGLQFDRAVGTPEGDLRS
jgi:hypothetical protein